MIVTLDSTTCNTEGHIKLFDRLSDPSYRLILRISHPSEEQTPVKPNLLCFICIQVHGLSVYVTSCNTPVTLLTNFWLVLGHTFTSICILRFPELMFCAQTWMHSQWHYPPMCHTTSGSSRSRRYPPPTLSPVYSLSLASCSCPTLLSCVSHSCNITFLCLPLALLIPPT